MKTKGLRFREVISVKEAANALKMTQASIRALLKKGVLDGFILGCNHRIYADSIPNYLDDK